MANTKKYVSLDKLALYDEKIKKVVSDGDAAALKSAKDYADSLAVNYDAAGSAASALGEAKTYADGKDAAIQAAQKAGDDAAAAAGVADGKAVKAQGDVDNLKSYVGTIPEGATSTNVVAYVQERTSGIATESALSELQAAVAQAQKDIDAVEADYLKGADKTELEGKITAAQNAADAAQGEVNALEQTHATDKKALADAIALKADQTALDEVSGVANAAATKTALEAEVKTRSEEITRVEGLVTAEAAKAREEEGKLDARLVEVETFFKTAEGETLDAALDTLVEIQKYVTDEGAAADEMIKDIAANAKAIEDHIATDHDFAAADATLKEELNGEIAKKADKTTVEGIDGRVTTAEGKITTVESKVSTLEGQMTTVQGAVATKAEAQALTDAVSALEGADTAIKGRLDAIETQLGTGEGSVSDQIADAKQEAIDAASADATSKANAAEAAAKGHADGLNTAMNTRVEALEAIDHEHTNKTVLDGITADNVSTWNTVTSKAAQSDLEAAVARIGVNEGAISTINTELAKKAAQADLTAVGDRVTAIENWHSNFVEVSEEEINGLFA